MFWGFSRPSSGAQWLQWQPLVLPSYCGDSRAEFVVGLAGPTTNTQHGCHHDTKVNRRLLLPVDELLMVGGRTPETCWAVNKRQDNKLENCCIWLVIYLNCTMMMHGLTDLKFTSKEVLFYVGLKVCSSHLHYLFCFMWDLLIYSMCFFCLWLFAVS